MNFVSYAQNFEDVLLWRALKHVQNGFYIDIGAEHPVQDSVSRAFYERGWRGVHVEPNPAYAKLLREDRPDETVIEKVVGATNNETRFFVIPNTGLSTCDVEIAERHREAGFPVDEVSVAGTTLAAIFDSYSDRECHWLKIDVEGWEKYVLQGWPPSAARPWVVVLESTFPNSQIETHENWENLIIDLDYEFVLFDGLSRFYVSKTHPELKSEFAVMPNVNDRFLLSENSNRCALTRQRLEACERELTKEHGKVERLEHELKAQIAQSRAEAERMGQLVVSLAQELEFRSAQGQAAANGPVRARAGGDQDVAAQIVGGQAEIQRLNQLLNSREQKLGARIEEGRSEIQRLTKSLAASERRTEQNLAKLQHQHDQKTAELELRHAQELAKVREAAEQKRLDLIAQREAHVLEFRQDNKQRQDQETAELELRHAQELAKVREAAEQKRLDLIAQHEAHVLEIKQGYDAELVKLRQDNEQRLLHDQREHAAKIVELERRESLLQGELAKLATEMSKAREWHTQELQQQVVERSALEQNARIKLQALQAQLDQQQQTVRRLQEKIKRQETELKQQMRYRMGDTLINAIDHPLQFCFLPWRITKLMFQSLSGRKWRLKYEKNLQRAEHAPAENAESNTHPRFASGNGAAAATNSQLHSTSEGTKNEV